MITKTFKALVSLLFASTGSEGYIPVKKINGGEVLLAPYFASDDFPCNPSNNVQINSNYSSPGIYLGTGDTAPTEDDYGLAARITTGLTASTPTQATGKDANGNPYKQILFTLTNTTSTDIIVKEIGYVQTLRAGLTNAPTVVTNERFLLDRTVLPSPVTVPANNGTAAIKYTLKTIIS